MATTCSGFVEMCVLFIAVCVWFRSLHAIAACLFILAPFIGVPCAIARNRNVGRRGGEMIPSKGHQRR